MRNEILRMNQVTYESQGVTQLDNFSLSVGEGEILGLVPVNNYGVEALFSLLTQNLPLRWGYVYYHEKLVNDWHSHRRGSNRISVIRNESCLAKDLTVADNIFVLRPGFRKWRIQPRILKEQLIPFIEEIGVPIRADAYIDELTAFQRFVVELLKAVVAGSRLIVLKVWMHLLVRASWLNFRRFCCITPQRVPLFCISPPILRRLCGFATGRR